MLRQSNQTAEKIIELIQTLPENEQKLIVHKLSSPLSGREEKANEGQQQLFKKNRTVSKICRQA